MALSKSFTSMHPARLRRFLCRFALAISAWLVAGNALAAIGDTGLLKADEAFRLSAQITRPGNLHLHWTIAPHYYLYRDRIHLAFPDAGVRAETIRLPPGLKEHDPYLGNVEIYHDALDADVGYAIENNAPMSLRVSVTFQGCHEVDPKICYPPSTQTLELPLIGTSGTDAAIALPETSERGRSGLAAALRKLQGSIAPVSTRTGAGTGTIATPASTQTPSDEQKLATRLTGHGLSAILAFFGFGLLLAFTPCVWPMIPILSGLIVGAGERLSTARAFLLSLTYVLANCVVFTLAGILAGLAGANLSAWMQKPAILIVFALIFVLLALSMFGLYDLQLPSSWQAKLAYLSNRQKAGSFLGVAVMGVLSALIVGPCVTPALGGAVLYIGQSRDPVFGGLALFALSLGMSAPLLVIGTGAGRWLPRAGAWMETVKAVFGVLFLGVAIWMLSRFLDPRWTLALTGALLVGCAIFLGALTRLPTGASGWKRFGQALGWIALILGACELVGAAAGSRDLLAPLGGMTAGHDSSAQTLDFRPVKSVDDLQRAIAAAKAGHRPVMLDFYADWCVSCKEMEAQTFSQTEVRAELKSFVLLRADVTANDADDQALLRRYGLFGPPATLFFGGDGKEQGGLRLLGYEDATDFVTRLHKAAP